MCGTETGQPSKTGVTNPFSTHFLQANGVPLCGSQMRPGGVENVVRRWQETPDPAAGSDKAFLPSFYYVPGPLYCTQLYLK